MTKLADKIAAANYSSMSLEQLNSLRASGNAKLVYNRLNFNYSDKCYSDDADSILKAVFIYCEGFVKDIASKYVSVDNHYEMSEKQAWCVAFAFIKIQKELGEEIF